jgi:hypothetical protein
VDEKGRETDVEDTDEVPGVNSPPLPPQPEVNKMSVRSYVDTVNDLRDKAAAAQHRDGKGTYDDPEVGPSSVTITNPFSTLDLDYLAGCPPERPPRAP